MGVRAKSGKLFLDFRWRGVRCREFTGLPDTRKNQQRCEAFLKVIEGEIELGTFDYRKHFPQGARLREFHPELATEAGADNPLLEAYFLSWHRERSPFRPDGSVIEDADLNPTTWLHEESVLRVHLIPAFGRSRIHELTRSRCLEFKRGLVDAGLKNKTVTNILGVLHKAMADAVANGVLETNPVPELRRKRGRDDGSARQNADPLTSDEVLMFLENVEPWFYDLYDAWFRLGWRPSEMMALRFPWLDFHRQVAQVRLGRSPRQGGIEARPKTGAREVDCRYDSAIFAGRQCQADEGVADVVLPAFTQPATPQGW